MITAILVVVCIILGTLLVVSLRKNLELDAYQDELSGQVDDSIVVLDDCLQRLTTAAKTPVMSDDPVVRNFIADVKRARIAIGTIADKIGAFDQDKSEDDEVT